ncbi:hypothetical protein BX666DRAFT_1857930 [Dichotomocladium elegans]|nr:hypothetical protein BX666DRAFT_1857930 [Dichotomocladium elegans]
MRCHPFFSILLLLFAAFFASTDGLALNPPIKVPNAHTVWNAGGTYAVEWNTTTVSGIPIPPTDKGIVMLGYINNGDFSEHLRWTLAVYFPLDTGHVNVTLPSDLPTGDNYIIVLFGDSGNASPQFTILGEDKKQD